MRKLTDFKRIRYSKKYGICIEFWKCTSSKYGDCVRINIVFINLEFEGWLV